MKTKLFLLIAVVFSALILFAGCGNSDNNASQTAKTDSESAGAAEDDNIYNLKFSSVRHEHSWYKAFYDDMIAEINERSNGRLVIEPFYNNTLGAPSDEWTMFTFSSSLTGSSHRFLTHRVVGAIGAAERYAGYFHYCSPEFFKYKLYHRFSDNGNIDFV